MKILFALLLSLGAASAHAKNFEFHFVGDPRLSVQNDVPPGITLQRLSTLTSDRDKNINFLNLMLDQNMLVAGLFNEAHPDNKPGEGEGANVFWLRDIESRDGVVLAEGRGRKALILKGLLDRETQEGRFSITYLANGLSMRYESCEFDLKRQPNGGAWYVRNIYTGATVTQIHVETHALGIKPIKAICKQ